jgi:hypothetical protein
MVPAEGLFWTMCAWKRANNAARRSTPSERGPALREQRTGCGLEELGLAEPSTVSTARIRHARLSNNQELWATHQLADEASAAGCPTRGPARSTTGATRRACAAATCTIGACGMAMNPSRAYGGKRGPLRERVRFPELAGQRAARQVHRSAGAASRKSPRSLGGSAVTKRMRRSGRRSSRNWASKAEHWAASSRTANACKPRHTGSPWRHTWPHSPRLHGHTCCGN